VNGPEIGGEYLRPRGYYAYRQSSVPSTTPAVRYLLGLNIGVFILQFVFLDRYLGLLGLVPAAVLGRGFLWQIVTYMFLHGSVIHILFNMLFLWMMGSELERYWGSRQFLKYYFVTGIGAGIINVLVQPRSVVPTIGASGAIFGLIIAFALAFPDRELLLYFVIRIKAKYFAVLVGVIELLSLVFMPNAPIARFAHLGGLAVGYIYLKRERLGYPLKRRLRGWQRRVEDASKQAERMRRMRIKAEVDRILDKISREGIGSLSDRERQFLERQGGRRS
jgi:membrane associated rhomboid family serine protease